MADSIYKWSKTASENDAADSIINWRENQLPDTVNDSARSMMKRIAEWRDDMSGQNITAGTQPAYTLTTNAEFESLSNGRVIVVRFHATNTGPASINVNGLGARDIRKVGLNGDIAVGVGDLQANGVYTLVYSSAANAGAGAWIVSNPASGTGFISGTRLVFAQATAPTGWTKDAANDDAALRVVSGSTGGTAGGTTAFSAAFTSRTPTGTSAGTAITAAQMPVHAHSQQGTFQSGGDNNDHSHWFPGGNYGSGGENVDHSHNYTCPQGGAYGNDNSGNGISTQATSGRNQGHSHVTTVNGQTGGISGAHSHNTTISGATTNAGGGAPHSHALTLDAMDFAVKYVDTIICIKD